MGKSILDLALFYGCGNAECIKVLDPAVEYDDRMADATLLIVLGAVFLGVSVPGCGAVGFVTYRSCRTREEGLMPSDIVQPLESGHYKPTITDVPQPGPHGGGALRAVVQA